MATIFTKIINGDIPCYKVAETDNLIAFLDISPLAKGHTLVVPKKEIDYIFDLDDTTYQELMLFSKKLSSAIAAVVPCNRIGMSVIGLEVPHTHVHLVPINNISDMDFGGKRVSLTSEEFAKVASDITKEFNG